MDRQESSLKLSSPRVELDVPFSDSFSNVSCGYNLRPSGSVSSIISSFTASRSELMTKNYLVGSLAGGAGSLLGLKELQKMIPSSSIDIQIVTWNMLSMKSQCYPEDLSDLFFSGSSEEAASIYAICIQECSSDKNELLIRLQAAVGIKHVLFTYATHGTLALMIFLNRDLIWYTSVPQSVGVTTSAAVRTKGAVAICFILFGTSLLFLSAHFKASHSNCERRVQDYLQVVNNINLPKVGFNKGYKYEESNPLDRFDVVFWAGDLNFRIQRPRHLVENVINGKYKHKTFEALLCADELLNAQSQGTVFQNFDEGRICFPPTYKFDINSDVYDSSEKQRVPSYTDRILFLSKQKGNLICLEYNYINTIRSSDHRPVFAIFSLILKPGSDNIALAAGAFNREIYIAGNQRRALRLDKMAARKYTTRTRTCTIQ
uniref:Inositol polyphosphate-5-phosphatase E n=1 Tax=Schistosoma japonicum TaxID=6182 RepID=C1LE13_SCHJA|nr:inositol polyphosphate-5-phosphatase E [Schistosoma japonicum]